MQCSSVKSTTRVNPVTAPVACTPLSNNSILVYYIINSLNADLADKFRSLKNITDVNDSIGTNMTV